MARDKNYNLSALIGINEDSWGNLKRIKYIISQLKKNALTDKRILEVGCGCGDHISIPLVQHGLSVLGIDVDKESIDYVNKIKLIKDIPNGEFLNIDINKIESNSFKVVVCSEVLEHLKEPQIMLKEIYRVLKTGGICIVTVPNGYGSFEIGEFIFSKYKESMKPWLKSNNIHKYFSCVSNKINRPQMEKTIIPGGSLNKSCPHIQKFLYKRLKELISNEGFEIIDAIGRTFLSGFISTPLIERSRGLIKLNANLASYMPLFMCSGWLITIKKN
ncbi:MAG: class I SAM-dependent methyltransferase [Nitrospiraceae bacterium]|nr:MAG: class I SAM-dependent methyltransferase [Nitrospiraceae bacterium]